MYYHDPRNDKRNAKHNTIITLTSIFFNSVHLILHQRNLIFYCYKKMPIYVAEVSYNLNWQLQFISYLSIYRINTEI